MSTVPVDLGLPHLPAFHVKAREVAASTVDEAREMSVTSEDWLAELDSVLAGIVVVAPSLN